MSNPDPIKAVWNPDVSHSNYTADDERAYQDALLKQYFKYIDSAEKVSDRRAVTNTFFITINSAIVTLVALFWENRPALENPWLLLLPLSAALALCATWFLLILSYRQLNGAKWAIIGEVESQLPLRLWGEAEWKKLKEGEDWRKYFKLTVAEQFVPAVFAGIYILGFVLAVTAG